LKIQILLSNIQSDFTMFKSEGHNAKVSEMIINLVL